MPENEFFELCLRRELNRIIPAANFRIKLNIGFQLSYDRFYEKN